ncbi:alpha/beta hydrolase [Hyalangium versicolor]|uniref:alpha/beta hydrolase n=1 Tax=Hyalangium versicolor TaxID=2861190 RepID=UPI001CCFC7AE|nr:alpha/beta fold hydrolase [Hyalangium versicolor]
MLRVKRVLLIFVGIIALGYVGLMGLMFSVQRSMLFPAPRSPSQEAPPPGPGFRRLSPPGGPVVDVLHLAAEPGHPTIVFFHGNGEQISYLAELGSDLHSRGLGFLAVEYPGYGTNPGTPSEQGLYQAAEVAIAELRAQGVTRESTVLGSVSLGGGVAVEMAKRGHGARMVLLAPFTSVADMGNLVVPFLPTRLLVRDPFDNASKAPGIDIPVLIFHGDQDEVIPVRMGQKMGQLFPHGRAEVVPGAHHNDLWGWKYPAIIERVAAFAASGQAAPLSQGGP